MDWYESFLPAPAPDIHVWYHGVTYAATLKQALKMRQNRIDNPLNRCYNLGYTRISEA